MKIKTADLQNILTTWIENKVLPKSNAFQAMAVTFAMLQAGDKISRITPLLMPDADGRIDLDKTIENARTALRKAGGRLNIPYINYVFDDQDITDIYQIAKAFGG